MPVELALNWAKDRVEKTFARHAVFVKNSGAIAMASVGAAAFGFVFWWLAARSFPPEVIGKTSAFISLMAFIGLIGEGGLGTLLTGEIVLWPGRERGLISAAAIVVLCLTLTAGVAGLTTTELQSTLKVKWLENLLLFVGCGLTGLSVIVDQAFVGILQSSFRIVRQISFSLFKMALIPLAAMWSTGVSDDFSLLLIWVASLMMSIILPELLMRRRGRSLIHRPDFNLLWTLKRKTADHYMLDLGILAPGSIMPYVVAVLLSPTSNAAFMVVWMIVAVAAVVPGAMATVLFPDIRSVPDQYREKIVLSLSASLLYAFVLSGLIFLYSKDILTLFNPAYAEIGGEHLRLLGLGMFGAVIKFHVCAAARLTNSMRQAALWFCIGGLFELACVAIGAWMGNLEGVSIGWASAVIIEGTLMMILVNPCNLAFPG